MKSFPNSFFSAVIFMSAFMISIGCNRMEKDDSEPVVQPAGRTVSPEDVAVLLSSAGVGSEQIEEVYNAVCSSLGNGYDEEYTMKNIFSSPGEGVGEEYLQTKAAPASYSNPLRDVLSSYLHSSQSKADGSILDANEYLKALEASDIQIYWPFSDQWDGVTTPVVTFDPGGESTTNVGYTLGEDGHMCKFMITEEYARTNPVWVVNCNEDAMQMSLDVVRKNHPEWIEGGNVIIGGTKSSSAPAAPAAKTSDLRTLVLKEFTMNRQYDNWFRGASEFFIKLGAVESFTAKTESDMYLYNPSITDFLVVVKRSQKGIPQQLGTVLVSEWTSQLESCAFMIVEDDGGTVTSWNCSAVVKYNSKSYGFEISLPYKSRDDIVWRGQLSNKYIETNNNVAGYFGDVMLKFEIKTY